MHIANHGITEGFNKSWFRRETPPFYTFKLRTRNKPGGGKGMLRFPCFRIENCWFITHGFWKPMQPDWPQQEIKLMIEIRKEMLQRIAAVKRG
jgi:hypothetical protein